MGSLSTHITFAQSYMLLYQQLPFIALISLSCHLQKKEKLKVVIPTDNTCQELINAPVVASYLAAVWTDCR